MASFYEIVKSYFTPYYWYILLFFSIVIFGFLTKYAYDKFYLERKNNKAKEFSDVANAEMRENDLVIYFFYVDWCPHCKTAFPEWVKFKNQYNDTEMNGYVVKCIDLNCTDETPEILTAINEYKIEGFPTVKMLKDNQKIEFDAKINYSSLEKFLTTMSSQ
jgi:thiol-disulfide isomerase/thioredoxin